MEFVVARGLRLSRSLELLNSARMERTSEGELSNTSDLECWSTGSVRVDRDLHLFDGHVFLDGRFSHSLLQPSTLTRFTKVIESPEQTTGLFCAATLSDGRFTLVTDPLSQYPIYCYRGKNSWAVSNSISLLNAALGGAGISSSKSLIPCLTNMTFGNVFDEYTHFEQISSLPFGCRILASESVEFIKTHRQDEALKYDECIDQAFDTITSHINAIYDSVAMPYVVADVTGGADSRCVLSFLLNSRHRDFGIRCITKAPHPDAIAASSIASKYQLEAGQIPIVSTVPAKYTNDLAVRMNAHISGGGREAASPLGAIAFSNFVHFKGSFGEIGGATPGSDHVQAAMDAGGYSVAGVVNAWIARRKMARALQLMTADAIEQARAHAVAAYQDLEDEGFGPDQIQSEMYLRTRSRNHFGLYSRFENATRILPDILGNRWIAEARRRIPRLIHTKNKVIFDLSFRNNPSLTLMPMAGKAWDRAIMSAEVNSSYKSEIITNETVATDIGPLFRTQHIADDTYKQYKPLSEGTYSPEARARFALAANLASYQSMLQMALDHFGQSDEVWRTFDRNAVEVYVKRQAEDFSSNGVDTAAMGIAASGLVHMMSEGMVPVVNTSVAYSPS